MSKRFLGVEQDGHRSLVHQLDTHLRPKSAGRDRYAELATRSAEAFEQRARALGLHGIGKARPLALAHVAEQRELRYGEQRAAGIEQASIHASGFVFEDA